MGGWVGTLLAEALQRRRHSTCSTCTLDRLVITRPTFLRRAGEVAIAPPAGVGRLANQHNKGRVTVETRMPLVLVPHLLVCMSQENFQSLGCAAPLPPLEVLFSTIVIASWADEGLLGLP